MRIGRRLGGTSSGSVTLSAFMPDFEMADTFPAKVLACIRPLCHGMDVSVNFGHSVALKRTRGILDRPFDARHVTRWNSNVPMSISDFFRYVPPVGDRKALRTVVVEKERLVAYIIHTVGARGTFIGRRILNIPGRQAYHDTLISHHIDRAARANLSFTARMLDSAVKVYADLGIRHVYLTAGLSKGGRIWPKYGFRPLDEAQWKRCGTGILQNFDQMPQQVRDRRAKLVNRLVKESDPLNIREIYALDDQVPDILNETQRRNLGPVLLTRTRWKGILDLSDPATKRIFSNAISKELAVDPLRYTGI